jgi:uncharacterized phage-associated protein
MPPVSAHDVADELRRQLPGLPTKKLHKLLYYCQGHHLAHFGEQLFTESVMTWDMGPVVAQLWKAEQDGRVLPPAQPLDAGQLNTIGYVVSRYGRLTGHDLELLSHAEEPWILADVVRPRRGTIRIDTERIRQFFSTVGGPEPDLPWPADGDIARLAAGADERRAVPGVPDDLSELDRRRAAR